MIAELHPRTREFYRTALMTVKASGVPFLVGGASALERYTGIERHTKDFDIFVRPTDFERVLNLFASAGYRTERTHPHWLGKVFHEDVFVDVIYRSGNALAEVDDEWFVHAVEDKVLDLPVGLIPPEEVIWTKGFVMERERFDGADVAHLIRAHGESLDWARLLRRFGEHWRVLLAHLIHFGYIYPGERASAPDGRIRDLLRRLEEERGSTPAGERICRGTHLSRAQYLVDLERWGYQDARLQPRGSMTPEDIARWTAAIARDGDRGSRIRGRPRRLERRTRRMARSGKGPEEGGLVQVAAGPVTLEGNLDVPEGARGVVLFAHGSGSSRHSPRNRFVAGALRQGGLATLLIDLLTPDEEQVDQRTAHLRFDIGLLAERLVGVTAWLAPSPGRATSASATSAPAPVAGPRSWRRPSSRTLSAQSSRGAGGPIWPDRRWPGSRPRPS